MRDAIRYDIAEERWRIANGVPADSSTPPQAYDAINRIAQAGITVGCDPPTNNNFCPDRILTRAEMATMLTRALGLTVIEATCPLVHVAHRAVAVLGVGSTEFHMDPDKRREYGLPGEIVLPKREDPGARDRLSFGHGWVRKSEITVSTDADQTPIAPGKPSRLPVEW